MTIGAYGAGWLAAARAGATFRAQKDELAALQAQLATGKAATTYAALGPAAGASLDGRARLAALDGFEANIADANLRLGLMGQATSQLDKLAAGLAALPGSLPTTSFGQTGAQVTALDGLRQALDVLNGEAGGRYLFAGRGADGPPVRPLELILDGDGTRAGLRRLVSERAEADRGADGRGRLVLGVTGATITLAEEAAGLPFGFKLDAAAASGTAMAASLAAGPPASVSIAVAGQPATGDALTLRLVLPDGTATEIDLTAGTDFAVGGDPDATAANLRTALAAALGREADTTLAAASTMAAASDFFAASAEHPPARVAGPPYASSGALTPGTAADTVIWYVGEDGSGSARETAPVRIGDGQSVALGARANEPALRGLLAALGALAVEAGATGVTPARAAALAERVADASGGTGASALTADLAMAKATLAAASERLGVARGHVEDLLGAAEDADPNAVAMRLLAAQTRLQASYQTTAQIARMSLVEFI